MPKWKDTKKQNAHLNRVRPYGKRYSPEILLSYLTHFIWKYGKVPTANEFRNEPLYPDLNHFYYFFGGWRIAIEMIGEKSRKYDVYKVHVKSSDGYWLRKINGKYIREHRIIVQNTIGRLLEPFEQVHHINGDRLDNRVENLQILTHREHSRITTRKRWELHHAKNCF